MLPRAVSLQEVVSVLRQGSRYEPPSDQRLLRALQQQVDYLGLAAPTVSHGTAAMYACSALCSAKSSCTIGAAKVVLG